MWKSLAGAWVVVVALLGAGCSGGGSAPSNPPPGDPEGVAPDGVSTVVPWSDATTVNVPKPTPSPTPTVDMSVVRACKASELETIAVSSGYTGGGIGGGISLRNTSGSGCYLDGSPTLLLLDAAGNVVDRTEPAPESSERLRGNGPVLLLAGTPPLKAHFPVSGHAGVGLNWRGWREGCGERQVALEARLVLPGTSDYLPVPDMNGQIQCRGSATIGSFVATKQSTAFVIRPKIQPQIDGPLRVKAGETLEYVVALENQGQAEVAFPLPCPYYRERLITSTTGGGTVLTDEPLRVLNCDGLLPIPVGGKVYFAMRLEIPVTVDPGEWFLEFSLSEEFAGIGLKRVKVTVE